MHTLLNCKMLSSRGFASLFAAALVLSTAAPVMGGEQRECFSRGVGDFDVGLAVWIIDSQPIERGDADASATIEVVDASEYKSLSGDHPFDAATLQIVVSAIAGLAGGAGAAESSVQMNMVLANFGDVLQFEVGGGFEHQFLGGAGHGIEVIVDVDGPMGGHASHVVYSSIVPPASRCGLGLSILGTLDSDPPTVTIDLEEGGIFWGEYITITIRVKAIAEAVLPCQSDISQAVVLLDNFRICEQFSLYDLNEDGQVNGIDLALLLGQWGPCPVCPSGPCPCPADFDFSTDVDGLDLAALLAFWG